MCWILEGLLRFFKTQTLGLGFSTRWLDRVAKADNMKWKLSAANMRLFTKIVFTHFPKQKVRPGQAGLSAPCSPKGRSLFGGFNQLPLRFFFVKNRWKDRRNPTKQRPRRFPGSRWGQELQMTKSRDLGHHDELRELEASSGGAWHVGRRYS